MPFAGRSGARAEADGGGSEAQARDACLRLLADRARSRSELRQRLLQRGFAVDIADRALDRLGELRVVDDAQFAAQWVQSRHRHAGRARRALAVELSRKGIDPEIAAEALADIDADDERERAAELVRRKLRGHSAAAAGSDDRVERDRLVRRLVGMLARRGYGGALALEVVLAELSVIDETVDEEIID